MIKKQPKTIEEACAESQAESNKWIIEQNRKAKKMIATLPEKVPFIFRGAGDKDDSLNFGQDIIILGYASRAENRGATYVYQGLANDIGSKFGVVLDDAIIQEIEELKKQGIKPRAVFWGFGNPNSDKDKEAAKQIELAVSAFRSGNTSYQEKEKAVENIDRIFTGKDHYNQIDSQLEQLFAGKLDEGTLETLVKDVDAQMQKVTLDTGSAGVVRFRSDGKIGYGKVSTNKNALINEQNALNAIHQDGLAKVLAPIPIGLAMTKDAGALFTWGTENRQLYDPKDIETYFTVFNTLLFSYAQKNGLNLRELAKDSFVQDVFNLALIHSSNIPFKSLNERPGIVVVDELQARASGDNESSKKLKEFVRVYEEAYNRVKQLNLGKPVFIHGDARPENHGKDSLALRPYVDWANAKIAPAVEDLASLEAPNTSNYAGWYNFVMEFRNGHILDKDSKDALVCLDVLQPFRTGSFKIGKGRITEANQDLKRLARNARNYSEHFGN